MLECVCGGETRVGQQGPLAPSTRRPSLLLLQVLHLLGLVLAGGGGHAWFRKEKHTQVGGQKITSPRCK